jgi:septal ring factor EnvC (AmiA/AmiB activator)
MAPQAENGRLQELLQRRKAEVTVLTQKRARLERQLERQEREAKALRAAGDRLQAELARVDALIGRHEGLKATLREEQLQLEVGGHRCLARPRRLQMHAHTDMHAHQRSSIAARKQVCAHARRRAFQPSRAAP